MGRRTARVPKNYAEQQRRSKFALSPGHRNTRHEVSSVSVGRHDRYDPTSRRPGLQASHERYAFAYSVGRYCKGRCRFPATPPPPAVTAICPDCRLLRCLFDGRQPMMLGTRRMRTIEKSRDVLHAQQRDDCCRDQQTQPELRHTASGTTALAISFPVARAATSKSYCACRLTQNSGVVPNRRLRRNAMRCGARRHILSVSHGESGSSASVNLVMSKRCEAGHGVRR